MLFKCLSKYAALNLKMNVYIRVSLPGNLILVLPGNKLFPVFSLPEKFELISRETGKFYCPGRRGRNFDPVRTIRIVLLLLRVLLKLMLWYISSQKVLRLIICFCDCFLLFGISVSFLGNIASGSSPMCSDWLADHGGWVYFKLVWWSCGSRFHFPKRIF